MNKISILALAGVASLSAAGLLISCNRQQGTTASPTPGGASSAPPLTLLYNSEELPGEKSLVAQTVQAQLKGAGIDVKLEPVPSTVYNDRTGKGDFQSALTLWYLDYDDAEGFLTDFYSKAGYRLSKYNNPDYDKAYQAALFASTEQEKWQKYKAAAKILDTDLPWIPLYSNSELYLMKPQAQGYRSNAYQYYDYRWVKTANIRAASDTEVQTLDPALCYDVGSKHLITQSYEGLIAMNEKNDIVPALATSWKFSSRGDALTFTLRPEVKFHGAAFLTSPISRTVDSSDVKATFERLIKANSPYSYIFDYVVGVDEFKKGTKGEVTGFVAESPSKFTIRLKRPFPTMLPWLLAPATYVLPKEIPAKYDFAKGSCGTGPFVLQSWNGSQAKFAANMDYWGTDKGAKLPMAKTLSVRMIKDANTLLLAYKNGELDVLNVPLPVFNSVLDENGKTKPEWSTSVFREVKLNNLKFIGFNMGANPWGGSADLRQRVSKALNRDEIVKDLFRGKARPATSIIPSGVAGFR